MTKDWVSSVKEVFNMIKDVMIEVLVSLVTILTRIPTPVKVILFLICVILSFWVIYHTYKNRTDYFQDFRDII